jgi:hypothetical protein
MIATPATQNQRLKFYLTRPTGQHTFQRQKFCPIMTSAFRKDTHTTALVQLLKDCVIDLRLINLRRNLEFCALKISILPASLLDIIFSHAIRQYKLSPSNLSNSGTTLEWFLQLNLLWSDDFQYLSIGSRMINTRQDQ